MAVDIQLEPYVACMSFCTLYNSHIKENTSSKIKTNNAESDFSSEPKKNRPALCMIARLRS